MNATFRQMFVRFLSSYLMDFRVRHLACIVASSWVGMTALSDVDAQAAAAPPTTEKRQWMR
jgi:hypothetical protein